MDAGFDGELALGADDGGARRRGTGGTCGRSAKGERSICVRMREMTREEERRRKREERAARAASGLKVCNGCKKDLPLSQFATRERMKRGSKKTIVESRCKPCLAAQQHKYITSESFKLKNKVAMKTDARKKWRAEYRARPHVVAYEENYRTSDAGRASLKKRKKRYYGNETWRAQQDRQNDRRRKRYSEDALVRLNICLTNTIGKMLHGARQTSRSLYAHTEFESAEDLAEHLEPLLLDGMTFQNYGSVWHVDHRVAKCWYSNSTEDIRRCWSKANLAPMFAHENMSKHIKIVDDVCNQVGTEYWPVAWGGVLPSMKERAQMYVDVCGGKKA